MSTLGPALNTPNTSPASSCPARVDQLTSVYTLSLDNGEQPTTKSILLGYKLDSNKNISNLYVKQNNNSPWKKNNNTLTNFTQSINGINHKCTIMPWTTATADRIYGNQFNCTNGTTFGCKSLCVDQNTNTVKYVIGNGNSVVEKSNESNWRCS